MGRANFWTDQAAKEGWKTFLATFPHRRFVVGLAHIAAFLAKRGSTSLDWDPFIATTRTLADKYLVVDTEEDLQCHTFVTEGGTHTVDEPTMRAAWAGWYEACRIHQLSRTFTTDDLRAAYPSTNVLCLTINFARACLESPFMQGKADEVERATVLVEDLLRSSYRKAIQLPSREVMRHPEYVALEMADAAYCNRWFALIPCWHERCADTAQGRHAHILPWEWPHWAEPEIDFPTIRSRHQGERVITERFGNRKLGPSAFQELLNSLDRSGLPQILPLR